MLDVAAQDPEWPVWPQLDGWSHQHVISTMLSGRLAVSGSPSAWPSRGSLAAEALARAVGRRHVVLTCNGASAIVVALQALGIGLGDVVLMPATTWVGCATAALRVGATPAFFDSSSENPCQPAGVGRERPAVILAVHLYAQHCDVRALREAFPSVPIVEDASHSQLAMTATGDPIGTLGDLSIMSLQETKVLTCGEGGAVLTDDDDMARRLDSLVMDSRRRSSRVPPTAPNELEPALRLHGTNFALAEMSAALLLDQLARFPAQAAARRDAARVFLEELDGSEWRAAWDEGAISSGSFYGVAVRIPDGIGTVGDVIDRVKTMTGLTLCDVYPPMPEGPLYRPATIAQYRTAAGADHGPFPGSRHWHERALVVPHQAFLGAPALVRSLASALRRIRGRPGTSAATVPGEAWNRPQPSIDVVVITRGNNPVGLERALASAAAQTVRARVRVAVWIDGGADLPFPQVPRYGPDVRTVRVTDQGLLPSSQCFERLGALRDLAAKLCEGDYVAFLDDDNEWDGRHLSTLLALAHRRGLPAVHSWRQLIGTDGRPLAPNRFPWLPPGSSSAERFDELVALGIMASDSSVVRDRFVFDEARSRPGMVDMGAWLFERRLLQVLEFRRPRTPNDIAQRLGEDDIILEQLVRMRVPVACTELATLRYGLGGMSTPEYASSPRHGGANGRSPRAAPDDLGAVQAEA